ncbi:hypothetical protein A2U01_0068585, partial [Trifolium medium]|nr:hypothetical protein [Trifolium medium]
EERFGDIDLGISRQAGSQVYDDGSVAETVSERQERDYAFDVGWQDRWSDDGRGGEDHFGLVDKDHQPVAIIGQSVTEERDDINHVEAIDGTTKGFKVGVEAEKVI